MNRPIGIAVGVGLVVLIALGAVASRVGTTPTEESGSPSGISADPASRSAGTMRRNERSAFSQSDGGKNGFAPASSVATRPMSAPKPLPGQSPTLGATADAGAAPGATVTPISPTTQPTPIGSNRNSTTVTTGNGGNNRPRRDPNARANAQANARMNAAARLQQAENQSIGRPTPLSGASAAAEQLESAPLVDQAGEPAIGMSPQMREQLLQQLLSGAGNNGSSSGSGSVMGSVGNTGSGSSGSDRPVVSSGSGGGGAGNGSGSTPDPPAGGSTGPPTTDTTGSLTAAVRWVPIDTPSGCANTTGIRIADLYVAVNTAAPVTAVESLGSTAVRVASGAFFQSATGSDTPPTSTNACDGVDSFLDLGGQTFIRLGSGDAFQIGQNGALTATWAYIAGVVPAQSRARFGDNQFYLRVARIAAPTGASVAGQILVAFRGTATTPLTELNVVVPNCIECWDTGATPPPPPPPDDGGETPPDDGGETPPDDGGETPPDDGGETPPDDGGGGTPPDDGGETPPDDGGETPPDDGGETPPDEGDDTFDLVWLPIVNTCSDPTITPDNLGGFKTYDLFIRMGKPHEVFSLDSGDSSGGITFTGQIFQFPDYGSNAPPATGDIVDYPCLAFDSFFDTNRFQPGFFVQPDPGAWTSPIDAIWYSPIGTAVRGTPNKTFGGTLYYFRAMRLTIASGASTGGTLRIGGRHFDGVLAIDVELDVPPLP